MYSHFFYKKKNGVFLEMGALNGLKYSNTWWLEKEAGWRGVLIEPAGPSYNDLKRNRPQALMFNAAICSEFTTVHYTENSRSAAIEGVWEFMSDSYRKRWHPEVTDPSGLPEVSCVPLNYLLHRYGIDEIDFWSLDVEGGELEVLKEFNFNKVRVNTMVVEMDRYSSEKNTQILALLAQYDLYPVHTDSKNKFFVRRGFFGQLSSAPGNTVKYMN